MKHLFSLMMGLYIFLTCQRNGTAEIHPFKLHYENAGGERGVTTFEYGNDGLLDIAVWELLDGSRFSINYYEHDEAGRLVRKYREFSDSLTSEQIFTYDEKGHLVQETFERSDGIRGAVDYQYNEQDQCTHTFCKGLNGWFFGTLYNVYNDDGQKIKSFIEQKNDTTGIISYQYDPDGYLIREHWDFNGKWSQTFNYENRSYRFNKSSSYTSSNPFITDEKERIVHENYSFNNETGGPSIYQYDEAGKLTKKIFNRSDGLTTTTRYLYDEKGDLARSFRKYSTGKTALFRYVYNRSRKLVEKSFFRSDGLTGHESYHYDEEGRLMRAELEKMDGWLTGEITFQHAGDKITEGKFTGLDNFDANIVFKYEKNNNPTQIRWDFSFGKHQTYWFEYQ